MADENRNDQAETRPSRRAFLERVGCGAVAGGVASTLASGPAAAADAPTGKVRLRKLGNTGLSVSEVGFGGHSWSYKRVPDGSGGWRKPTVDDAVEMISAGLEMGVNYFDSCTPLEESSTPGEAIKRLKKRDQVIRVRPSHKMKGRPNDKKEVFDWTEKRLKLWQTDRIDLLLLANTANDTPDSGYWDMSYSIEACDKLKKEGKIRFTGFGCHFTPEWFVTAFEKFGKDFDVCSMPYNVRHRVAEEVIPKAKKAGLGVVTIKPFARGSLLRKRDLTGKDAGLPRDMISFVLENEQVDVCLCGLHTLAQVKENFSASWTRLTPGARQRLGIAAANAPIDRDSHGAWLENGWRYA